MATFLEIFFLDKFSPIFILLLVFTLVYAILKTTKVLGDSNNLIAMIAMAVAFLVILSSESQDVIKTIMPLFFILLLFIFFMLVGLRFLGMEEGAIKEGMKHWGPVHIALLVVVCLIFAVGLAAVFGNKLLPLTQNTTSVEATDYGKNVAQAIFHPKVLGIIFILIVSMFAILLLTTPPYMK
ncbi:MAG: hypothetical protein QXW00_00410 [Candidatus Woesearchaeota archaeon]